MSATARLAAQNDASNSPHPRPIVLVDGVPEPGIEVVSIEWDDRTGRSSTRLFVSSAAITQPVLLEDRLIQVVVPVRLSGDETHEYTIVSGRTESKAADQSAGRFSSSLTIIDGWSEQLDTTAKHRWMLDANGTLLDAPSGWLGVGGRANRSANPVSIGNATAYVPSSQQESWTVEQALGYIATIYGFTIDLRTVSSSTRSAELINRVGLTTSLDTQLNEVLEPYGLWARTAPRPSSTANPHIVIVDPQGTDRVRLAESVDRSSPTSVISQERSGRSSTSQQWIAQAGREICEGTFLLIGNWDVTLESAPDTAFDQAQSTEFPTYANVFRRWVLNEDASVEADAFDLSGFFGFTVDPRPIPFADCLTLDDTLNRRPPIAEYSIDAGSSWLGFAGRVLVLRDRAGIYLDMTTLPVGFVDAGRSGQLQVRVTASLQSPVPEEVTRWRGNPFFDVAPPERFDLSAVYQTRTVHSSSIHRARIDVGTLLADEQQAGPLLEGWLADRLQRTQGAGLSSGERSTLRLSGWWWTLRPGDRIERSQQHSISPHRPGVSATPDVGVITRVRFCGDPGDSRDGTTELEVAS